MAQQTVSRASGLKALHSSLPSCEIPQSYRIRNSGQAKSCHDRPPILVTHTWRARLREIIAIPARAATRISILRLWKLFALPAAGAKCNFLTRWAIWRAWVAAVREAKCGLAVPVQPFQDRVPTHTSGGNKKTIEAEFLLHQSASTGLQ